MCPEHASRPTQNKELSQSGRCPEALPLSLTHL